MVIFIMLREICSDTIPFQNSECRQAVKPPVSTSQSRYYICHVIYLEPSWSVKIIISIQEPLLSSYFLVSSLTSILLLFPVFSLWSWQLCVTLLNSSTSCEGYLNSCSDKGAASLRSGRGFVKPSFPFKKQVMTVPFPCKENIIRRKRNYRLWRD